eukprot:CAMPEP_0182569088 /NCGR_PEP_ID=MMETSP1324-20130603/9826_1 /TAXON_ID=236786 /ORGANISM="Florenciella sp., Strain RCC1587" /LENGTH=69 /DNA_ID=CAMNT_0024783315 /DNA_START=669 /DNA_END=878 /DNA_ORIENTATION=-
MATLHYHAPTTAATRLGERIVSDGAINGEGLRLSIDLGDDLGAHLTHQLSLAEGLNVLLHLRNLVFSLF